MAPSSTSKPLRVAVIGPAGFGGSYLCVELINRGHYVVGLSRNPEKLGSHANYEPRRVDVDNSAISQLAEAMQDVDVVVSEYGPHTAGHQALQYSEPIRLLDNSCWQQLTHCHSPLH